MDGSTATKKETTVEPTVEPTAGASAGTEPQSGSGAAVKTEEQIREGVKG